MSEKQTSETWGNLPQRKHVYRGEDLLYKLQALKAENAELKSIIKEMITIIDEYDFIIDDVESSIDDKSWFKNYINQIRKMKIENKKNANN